MMRGGAPPPFRSSEKRKNFQEKYFLECTGPPVLRAHAKFLQTPAREELTWVNLEFELKFRTVILLALRRPCGICSPNGPHCISGYLVSRKKFDFLAQLLPVLFPSSLAVLQTGKTFISFFRENSLRRSYIGFVDTYILRLLPLSSSAAIPQNPTRSAF